MLKQIDFRWRYQPCKRMDIKLMSYIQSNLIKSKTEVMLVAVRSFWLTHAVAANSDNKKDVQSIAISCIKALEKQAQEIGELAGLEEQAWIFLPKYTVNPSSNQSLNKISDTLGESRCKYSDIHNYDDTGLSNFI
ncbi:hypothetical protein [Calothrix sp. PCC 6303]|uniref:hypothetical protein n=2 Tax=Calothrix sp. PCC 6303 TaxID=1170562 RepID=UPI0002A006FD|nr:hypothetical protein [Calothrix sp. PCC 6303]AFY99450.1 hypothetical protein Cal6303_0370 [Calothrix sp. PCC 6303]